MSSALKNVKKTGFGCSQLHHVHQIRAILSPMDIVCQNEMLVALVLVRGIRKEVIT